MGFSQRPPSLEQSPTPPQWLICLPQKEGIGLGRVRALHPGPCPMPGFSFQAWPRRPDPQRVLLIGVRVPGQGVVVSMGLLLLLSLGLNRPE